LDSLRPGPPAASFSLLPRSCRTGRKFLTHVDGTPQSASPKELAKGSTAKKTLAGYATRAALFPRAAFFLLRHTVSLYDGLMAEKNVSYLRYDENYHKNVQINAFFYIYSFLLLFAGLFLR